MPLDLLVLDSPASDCTFGLETPELGAAILDLTDRAFGPGRYVKTAERLREGSRPLAHLSFVAKRDGKLAGSVRLWPITVTDEASGHSEAAVFLGPIVVDPAFRGLGIGKALVRMAVAAADTAGVQAIVLVGAQSFFAPFNFTQARSLVLPGPVDPKRLLVRYAQPGLELRGQVRQTV